jgi:hypothetical protein
MGVLDHEQEARSARQPPEQAQEGFEQPGLPGIDAQAIARDWLAEVTKIGQQPGKLWAGRAQELLHLVRRAAGRKASQRLGQRSEGQPRSTELDTCADEHDRAALARSADDLLDETGLPNASLTGDEEQTRTTTDSILEGRLYPVDLGLPADENGA